MTIPDFNEHGRLPPGVHDCGLDEVRDRLGAARSSDHRPKLFDALTQFVAELGVARLLVALVVDGSFVTAKPDPGEGMIRNEEDLAQALDQLGRMARALAALRDEILPKSPKRYALMAEGPLDEIRRLHREIDEYAGVASAEEQAAELWLSIDGPSIVRPDAPRSGGR